MIIGLVSYSPPILNDSVKYSLNLSAQSHSVFMTGDNVSDYIPDMVSETEEELKPQIEEMN